MIPDPPEFKSFKGLLKNLRALRDFAIRIRPLESENCDIDERTEGSRILPGNSSGGGGGSTSTHPFKVYQRNNGTAESPVWQYGVEYNSSLYQSLRPNHKQTITGLLSSDKSTGWFNLTAGGYIWLLVSFNSSGVITGAEIDNSDDDDFTLTAEAWSANDSYCEDNGGTPASHQKSRKLIAYTVSTSGIPAITQVMFRDQLLRNVCVDSRPARYPFDHEGGYPL